MNRIYQGKVTAVEILDGTDELGQPTWRKLNDWQAALWQHHQSFQDAVNYYTLALAAMAGGVEGNSPQANALRGWSAQVKDTWSRANRRAETFDGPQTRLASILGLKTEHSDFEAAANRVLRSSCATPEQRAAAVEQFFADKGDLNVICVARLPWFATATGKLSATSKTEASSQEAKRQQVVRSFHQWPDDTALERAAALDLGLFLTKPPKDFAVGENAKQMLNDYFVKGLKKFPELQPVAAAFNEFVANQMDALRIPSPGRKPSGLYPLAAVFRYFPTPETLRVFRAATKTLAEAKDKALVADAVAESRVADQPHFDYFTNLAFVSGRDAERPDTRAVWFEFDLAAFIEAVKAPRRYFEDTLKREATADSLRQQISAMENRGREASNADEESEPLHGFDGDERINLLKRIVQDKLRWVAETEVGSGETDSKEYEIRERTVRGFGEIKRRWRAAVAAGEIREARLLEILAEEQAAHRDDFGSATLYQQLAKPEFHPIWRSEGTQPWHADDPLTAWLQYKELKADLADKERAIRFTPAHPKYSPRFFIFPKKSEAQQKGTKNRMLRPGLHSRHEPGQLCFTCGIILQTSQGLTPTVVRAHYAAPRLCRDHLRSNGDTNLYEAPWLQPMMEALGLHKSPERVNFANCRITLQPITEANIQLTFPVEVNSDKIKAQVSREAVWDKQFNLFPDGKQFYNASLRWPHEKQPAKPPVPWFEQVNEFRCLATDLGQRDAGAFARLLVVSGSAADMQPSRFIGETGGKHWRAALERTGLLRLPGEDAEIWRERSSKDEENPGDSGKPFDFREELWGERGRPARDWEAGDTAELMRLLEFSTEEAALSLLPENWRSSLSFPEQNDKLLVAMRRYQSRISRLHRWCCFLKGDEKQQQTAWDEMAGCDDTRLISAEQSAGMKKRDPRLVAELESQLRQRLHLVPTLLVRIANRILPLRGRSWHWEKHPTSKPENTLHQLTQNGLKLDSRDRPVWLRGQRGLSMERIEQVAELRKRFQSLNQTLRRKIGGKAPASRDESVPDPCPDILEKLENLKEQRANQTAHMILAQALGLRLAPPPADKKALRRQRDQHGSYEKIQSKSGEWIAPVDFIIIEDLSRYRASQGRAPRENSRLMKWCHREVRNKLKQLCEVFGLPLVETPAAYSSRFCSRSGVPGFRATEIAPGFEYNSPWSWLKEKKDERGQPTAEAAHIHELIEQMTQAQKIPTRSGKPVVKPRTLFAPLAGGPVFIPAVDSGKTGELPPRLAQADINAAINLALRAIANPKLWAIHPRLRSQRDAGHKSEKTRKQQTKQDASQSPTEAAKLLTREKRKFGDIVRSLTVTRPAGTCPDDNRQPNFFADLAGLHELSEGLAGKNPREHGWLTKEWTSAEIPDESPHPPLIHGKSFWGTVKAVQWQRIRAINVARLAGWRNQGDTILM